MGIITLGIFLLAYDTCYAINFSLRNRRVNLYIIWRNIVPLHSSINMYGETWVLFSIFLKWHLRGEL